jgi:protein-disulfide isomerase
MLELRKASPFLVAITFVLVLVLLFQVNSLNKRLDFIEEKDEFGNEVVLQSPKIIEDVESIIIIEGDTVLYGNPESAKVIIVEYGDFECPYCKIAVPVIKSIADKYENDLAVVFKDFPLAIHTNAKSAAVAAQCANEQGLFTEYHDILYQNQDKLSSGDLLFYASQVGLDTNLWVKCIEDPEMLEEVNKDHAQGLKDGVRGTPGFFVNGVFISGAQPESVFIEEIEKYI